MSKIFNNLGKYKEKIGLIDIDSKEYSYKEIVERVKKINKKINKNSLVLLIASNIFESIVGYIAFAQNKNITILLDENFNKEFIEKIIESYKPSFVYKPKKIVLKNINKKKIYNGNKYELIKTNFIIKKKYNKKNFLLLTTSGSTQNPKLVRLSEDNILNNVIKIKKYLNIKSNNITITNMPMAYSYGLSIINSFLYSGAKIVLNDKTVFDKDFWLRIRKYKVNSLSGVPEFFNFLKKLKLENLNMHKIKYLTHAGGKLDNDTIKYFTKNAQKKDYKFYSMYGQTEASPRMSYLDCVKNFNKIGSIGKPLDGARFHIVNYKRKKIKKNFVNGEIVYVGKNVCLGYANTINDLYKGDINKGRLFTGDIGYKDNDGFYFLTARKSRISKIFGIRFNLDDIENKLKKNNFDTKLISTNNYLKILIINNYNTDLIKDFIFKKYKINKKFIYVDKVKKFTNTILFKK